MMRASAASGARPAHRPGRAGGPPWRTSVDRSAGTAPRTAARYRRLPGFRHGREKGAATVDGEHGDRRRPPLGTRYRAVDGWVNTSGGAMSTGVIGGRRTAVALCAAVLVASCSSDDGGGADTADAAEDEAAAGEGHARPELELPAGYEGYTSEVYADDAHWLCKPGIEDDVCSRDLDATPWPPTARSTSSSTKRPRTRRSTASTCTPPPAPTRAQQRLRPRRARGDRHRLQPGRPPVVDLPGVRPRVPPAHHLGHRRRRRGDRRSRPARRRLRRRARRVQGLHRQRERRARLRPGRPLAGRRHAHPADRGRDRRRAAAARPARGGLPAGIDGARARGRGRGRHLRQRAPVRAGRPDRLRRVVRLVPLDQPARGHQLLRPRRRRHDGRVRQPGRRGRRRPAPLQPLLQPRPAPRRCWAAPRPAVRRRRCRAADEITTPWGDLPGLVEGTCVTRAASATWS